VKLFQNNQVTCFEVVATFINNWCQHWFEFFPNAPVNILNMIENLLSYHDKVLLDHFVKYRITCQLYGWSLLQTIFSEVFSKNEWQILFDNIFSQHPGYMLYLVVAYSICNRSALVQVQEIEDARYFFRHKNPLSVNHLLNEAARIQLTTPADIDPCQLLNDFEPLTKGTYPVFNKRPRFISDYQIIEKKKILQQEIDYLKERDAHLESHKMSEGLKLENEYLLKQLLWDANNNKQFKQSVEEYEKNQMKIEEQRRKEHLIANESTYKKVDQKVEVTVASEPLITKDKKGKIAFNKMKIVNEDLKDIENLVIYLLNCSSKNFKILILFFQLADEKAHGISRLKVVENSVHSMNNSIQSDNGTETNYKEIESELRINRSIALQPPDKIEENKIKNHCLNASESIISNNCKYIS
jgi:hypothetical protein